MKIHTITHNPGLIQDQIRQTFCGPAAISAITGRTAECGAAWINKMRGRPIHHSVGGTFTGNLIDALRILGYCTQDSEVTPVPKRRIGKCLSTRPTFAQWLRSTDRNRTKMYLVNAGHHFMVVKGTKVVCNQQPQGNPTGRAMNRRSLVRRVFEIQAIPDCGVRRMRLDPMPVWDAHREELATARHSDNYGYGPLPKRRWEKKHEVS